MVASGTSAEEGKQQVTSKRTGGVPDERSSTHVDIWNRVSLDMPPAASTAAAAAVPTADTPR
jgi:hypothetical protein